MERVKPKLMCTKEENRTKQSFKNMCNINEIMKKYKKNGELPGIIKENPKYGDFTNVPTYQEGLNTIIKAQAQFDALPSNVRKRFHNEPAEFLEFVNNEENKDEMIKMGLAVKKEEIKEPAQKKPEPKATEEAK